MEGFAGVTAMETRAAAVTVKPVEPLIEPEVALIVVVPAATAVARPPALTVATAVERGGPGGAAGEVLMAAVGVGTGGGELLLLSGSNGGIGRRHGD